MLMARSQIMNKQKDYRLKPQIMKLVISTINKNSKEGESTLEKPELFSVDILMILHMGFKLVFIHPARKNLLNGMRER